MPHQLHIQSLRWHPSFHLSKGGKPTDDRYMGPLGLFFKAARKKKRFKYLTGYDRIQLGTPSPQTLPIAFNTCNTTGYPTRLQYCLVHGTQQRELELHYRFKTQT